MGVEQLERHLRGKLACAWLVTGDEPLQVMETADAIRSAAKSAGFLSHERFHGDLGLDWNEFRSACDTYSLFGEPRLLDVRLTGKPDKAGAEALLHFTSHPQSDALVMVTLPRLSAQDQKVRWFQAFERIGVVIQVWPLEGDKLLKWLDQRLNSRGLLADQSAIRLLAARVEGNLLAAAQDIEKLRILHGGGRITDEDILRSVADNARYDVFDLVDQVLRGQIGKAHRILSGLRAEGVAAPVVLWALTRELRLLNLMQHQREEGLPLATVIDRQRVWESRKTALTQALNRLRIGHLREALLESARVDRIMKGQEPGEPWNALLRLCGILTRPDSIPGARRPDAR